MMRKHDFLPVLTDLQLLSVSLNQQLTALEKFLLGLQALILRCEVLLLHPLTLLDHGQLLLLLQPLPPKILPVLKIDFAHREFARAEKLIDRNSLGQQLAVGFHLQQLHLIRSHVCVRYLTHAQLVLFSHAKRFHLQLQHPSQSASVQDLQQVNVIWNL